MNDFSRQNLRGWNFKGQDLTGADFSGADIRGATFTNAILREAKFTGAKAGLRKRWVILQAVSALVLSALLNFVSIFFTAAIVASYFTPKGIQQYTILPGLAFLFVLGAVYFAIACRGATAKAFGTIMLCVAVAVAIAVAGAVAGAVAIAVGITVTGAVAGAVAAGAVATLLTVTVAVGVGVAVAGIVAIAGTGTGAVGAAFAFALALAGSVVIGIAGGVTVTVAVLTMILSFYVAWRMSKEDEKFALARSFGITLSALGGTNFQGADLTGTTFSGALLKNTNFANSRKQETTLTQVCWKDAKKLNRAQVGDSILTNRNVRELLVTGKGINQNFESANLRGADLTSAKLNGAILKYADLGEAILTYADLQHANLTEAQAIGANFTGAYLTGACIEAWNIDSTTNLQDVDAKFVYLLENEQERRPSSSEFAPGEFTTLFQKALNTVDLIFRDGIDWKAFFQSFQELRSQYSDENLSIQAIEKKSDGAFIIRLEVSLEADKAKIERQAKQLYEGQIRQLEERVAEHQDSVKYLRQSNANLEKVIQTMAENQSSKYDFRGSNIGNFIDTAQSGSQQSNIQYVNMSQDLTQAAQQIQDLLQQLQNQGVTVADSQQQVATDLANQAKTNPAIKKRLALWGKAMANKASETTVSEAAKLVLTLALKAAGVPLP
ncbi:pentapeptide repeat-containing protein [Leptolyngbya sp. FACHB-402]|nr:MULTISPECIES: pentapeptide repeat-containing protein [unclassified Leptolyngbya]MBD2378137.1 pentapeptide repeat-containing protein [Leptolyngbya sp. FACHB-238]MBD2402542.1 pentapeptide repeat-containing protein [Leptolyngbya sp. FACHB-239]MBD2409061.1 pentapeptide repeat-containing protein [Leptolyngbya sp. FACHB-402]